MLCFRHPEHFILNGFTHIDNPYVKMDIISVTFSYSGRNKF